MKRFLSYLLMVSIIATSVAQAASSSCKDSCECECTGRSYLFVRPNWQSASPERVSAFRGDRSHAREDGFHGAFQVAVFGGKTTNEKDLARYFSPNCKCELTVDEDPTSEEDRDLLAQHFNIFTVDENFRSKIKFEPKQSVIGVGFEYRQSFWRNEESNKGFWFAGSLPIVRVKNSMNLTETIISDGGGADEAVDENVVANMKDAFNQSEWKCGKINACKTMDETKVADIELKVGYEWLDYESCHLESYVGVLIPTGNTPDGKFIFEPVVGHGKHAGILFGSGIGLEVYHCQESDRVLRLELATHSQYLFGKTHKRAIDLKNRPWSRYLEVYADEEQAQLAETNDDGNLATPGINVFCQCVDVKPGFSHNINWAGVLTSGGFQGELGYNFYCRQAECVKLACPWKVGPALKAANGIGTTNPIREISGNEHTETIIVALADFADSQIKAEDLDLSSAASPCLTSHSFYGSLGYRWDERGYPIFINGGGSYELAGNSSQINRWTVWGKAGFSF